MAGYPKREAFFAHRYCRLLVKTCAAQEIGPLATLLCMIVSHQEDSCRYLKPITYHNGQLMMLLGINDVGTLRRARSSARNWLHYDEPPNGSRLPGVYWCVIPEQFEQLPDDGVDEELSAERVYYWSGYEDAKAGREPRCQPATWWEKPTSFFPTHMEKPTRSPTRSPTPFIPSPSPGPSPERTEDGAEAAARRSAPPLLVFTCRGAPREWELSQAQLDEWTPLYDGLDLLTECRKALAWANAHPTKRKTARGMKGFLVRWFNREANSRSRNHQSDNRQSALGARTFEQVKLDNTQSAMADFVAHMREQEPAHG